jgi:hypothetical protein
MTEELENKLNELLGMKKQIEELTADKKQADATSIFEKRNRKTKIYLYIYLAIAVVITLLGIMGIQENKDEYKLLALFMAIVGFETTVLMKMWYHTITTKLSILQEMKQFEIRLTEMLKK